MDVTLHLDVGHERRVHAHVGGEVFSPTQYHGSYTVTPSDETQVLATAGTSLTQDVVIEPIPGNYGRIGWNGSVITVS